MQRWAFYPGYQHTKNEGLRFAAYQPWSNTKWIQDGNFGYDYAFVITQTNAVGSRLVDRVGGNGLIINPGRPAVTAIGYPGNFAGGNQQAYCQTKLTRRSLINRDQKLNCDMRGGASGSAWLKDYSNATGLGWAVSNQSYSLHEDGRGPEFGPYYDDTVGRVYDSAEAASP